MLFPNKAFTNSHVFQYYIDLLFAISIIIYTFAAESSMCITNNHYNNQFKRKELWMQLRY